MQELLRNRDAVLVQNPSNLFYCTSYKNADAKLLFWQDKRYYFTDARYFEEAAQIPDVLLQDIKEFPNFLKEHRIREMGTDGSITLEEYASLQEQGITKVDDIQTYIHAKRAKKTPKELEKIQKAQAITDKTFSDLLPLIREGMTEKELDTLLKCTLYQNGADELAFDPIVAFGKNSSKPHAHAGQTVLQTGMMITLDFGAKTDGYCSDMTRTVAFGKIGEEEKKVYGWVLEAQQRALDLVHTGMTGEECHRIAVDTFARYGVQSFFTHSLGHSLGIDIHETPCLSPRWKEKIEENTVSSVEPGLYFPEKFGVRIEDIIVFTKNGIINLTKSKKELIII